MAFSSWRDYERRQTRDQRQTTSRVRTYAERRKKALRPPRLAHLDLLRALALIQVSLFHQTTAWQPSGYFGVLTFFALSSYLIFRNYLWGRMAEAEFLGYEEQRHYNWQELGRSPRWASREFWRHSRKLWGPMLLMLLVVTVLMLAFYPGYMARQGWALRSAIFGLNNWQQLFAGGSYFEGAGFVKPFTHLWALSMEWQYYILIFFVFIPLYQRLSPRHFRTLLYVLYLLSGTYLGLALVLPRGLETAYFNSFQRLGPFLLGLFLATCLTPLEYRLRRARAMGQSAAVGSKPELAKSPNGRSRDQQLDQWQFAAFALSGLLLIVLPCLGKNLRGAFTWGFHLFTLALGVNIFLALILDCRGRLPRRIDSLRFISSYAYIFYLWHYPIRALLEKAYARRGINTVVFALLCLGLSLIVCVLAVLIPQSSKELLRRSKLQRRQIAGPVAALAAVLLLCLPYSLFGKEQQAALDEIKAKIQQYEAQDEAQKQVSAQSRSIREAAEQKAALAHEAQQGKAGATETQKQSEDSSGLGPEEVNPQLTEMEQNYELKMLKYGKEDPELKLDLRAYEKIRERKVTVIGDSLGVFLTYHNAYYFPNMTFDTKSSRQMHEAREHYEALKSRGELGDALILLLGTNGSVRAEEIDPIYQDLQKQKIPLLLCTVALPWPDQESENNQVLRSYAESHKGVYLVDWNRLARRYSEALGEDEIHPSGYGCELYMQAITKALLEALQQA